MQHKFSTHIQLFFLKLFAKLPFWLIYFLSDVSYYAIYYGIGYRKKVVLENLRKSFPEMTEKERESIARKFFRHFCDLTLETIKMRSMPEKQFQKRVKAVNPEILAPYYEQGKSVVILSMHYNNWEWAVYLSKFLKHKALAVYKPLQDKQFDAYINKNRSRFGAELVKNAEVLRRVIKAEQQKEIIFLWLAGDQTPPGFHKTWFRFLNQDALFYPGPAAIAKRFNYPVFFQKMEKTKRGVYETTFELLFDDPTKISETEIIKTYIRKLEEVISEMPEFYLWSHKRWKHKRPANIELQ